MLTSVPIKDGNVTLRNYDRPTDQWTNQPTNRQTDRGSGWDITLTISNNVNNGRM